MQPRGRVHSQGWSSFTFLCLLLEQLWGRGFNLSTQKSVRAGVRDGQVPSRHHCHEHFQVSLYPKTDPSPLLPFKDVSVFDPFCSHLLTHCTLTRKIDDASCSPLSGREGWGGHAPLQPCPSSQTFPSRVYRLQPGSKLLVGLFGPISSRRGGSRFPWLAFTSCLGLPESQDFPLPPTVEPENSTSGGQRGASREYRQLLHEIRPRSLKGYYSSFASRAPTLELSRLNSPMPGGLGELPTPSTSCFLCGPQCMGSARSMTVKVKSSLKTGVGAHWG